MFFHPNEEQVFPRSQTQGGAVPAPHLNSREAAGNRTSPAEAPAWTNGLLSTTITSSAISLWTRNAASGRSRLPTALPGPAGRVVPKQDGPSGEKNQTMKGCRGLSPTSYSFPTSDSPLSRAVPADSPPHRPPRSFSALGYLVLRHREADEIKEALLVLAGTELIFTQAFNFFFFPLLFSHGQQKSPGQCGLCCWQEVTFIRRCSHGSVCPLKLPGSAEEQP